MFRKKMVRDLMDNKGAYISCIIVMMIGLMIFISFSAVLDNLKLSRERFYKNQNFADGFAQVEAIPFTEVKKLESIEGISQIQGRYVKDVQVLFPDRKENVFLRLLFIDPDNENLINDMLLLQGSSLNNQEMNIWVDNKFFEANNLNLNDEIEVIASGRIRNLNITGLGQSPEFIYALRTMADLYPSPETFGIAFVPIGVVQTLFPGENTFNDLVFTLEPGTDYDEVKDILEHELKPYGLKSLISSDDQTSNFLLMEEIRGLESMSKAVPILFLSIASMILYIVVKRMIEQQRGQIGILKAFGYTHREIIFHYLSYALAIGLIGGTAGVLLGFAVSYPFTSLFQMFFNMPLLTGQSSPVYLVSGIFLSLLFSLFAGYQGCKKILVLEPAEAMRPSAPIVGGATWLEKISLFWSMLTVQGKMAVRNLTRSKGRSLFIFLGIMFCFSITAFTGSMNNIMQMLMFDQYERVEVYDVLVTLSAPLNRHQAARELSSFPGVNSVEALAEVPVTLKNKWHKKDVVLMGIPADSRFYNILDKDYKRVDPPQNGILLSERLAEVLEADIGTTVSIENLMLPDSEQDKQLEVVGIIPQHVGLNAYTEIKTLHNVLKQGELATSFMLSVEKESILPLQEKYSRSDFVSAVEEKEQRVRKLEEMMETYGSMVYIYAFLGVIIGFAIIYSSSIITISERSRELASMMVLGMMPAEVLSVVTFEQWFIGIFAMIVGIPMSKLMITGISQSFSSDVFMVPAVITMPSFITAFMVTCISIWIAQKFAARKIRNISLVEVLKAAE